jgi:hypothetical protein
MSTGVVLVAAAYVALGLATLGIEIRRTRGAGLDVVTVFLAMAYIQLCIAPAGMFALLPFVDQDRPTGVPEWDGIFKATHLSTAWFVWIMVVWFVLFFYAGLALTRLALPRPDAEYGPRVRLEVSDRGLIAGLAVALILSIWVFQTLGDSLFEWYGMLILFRSGYEGIERTALLANAYSFTQTWAWLSVVCVFAVLERRGRGVVFWMALALVVAFALLSVSRRAIFFPLLFSYLTLTLVRGRWRLGWLVAWAVPLVCLLALGKELFTATAFGGTGFGEVAAKYQTWLNAVLRACTDACLTIVESLGTLEFLRLPPRFGVDHLLALAQRFPEGMLGLDFNFPERIVRTSTVAFSDLNQQDIPPGLVGQMWMDFRLFGPVVWGVIFGAQVALLQFAFERTEKTLQSAAIFVLLAFIVALPLNTGSFDFSFSNDIFAFLACLILCVRSRPISISVQPAELAASPLKPAPS